MNNSERPSSQKQRLSSYPPQENRFPFLRIGARVSFSDTRRGTITGTGQIQAGMGIILSQYIVKLDEGFFDPEETTFVSHIIVNVENFDSNGKYLS